MSASALAKVTIELMHTIALILTNALQTNTLATRTLFALTLLALTNVLVAMVTVEMDSIVNQFAIKVVYMEVDVSHQTCVHADVVITGKVVTKISMNAPLVCISAIQILNV